MALIFGRGGSAWGRAAALAGARGKAAERARGVARRQPVGMDDQQMGGAAALTAGDERTESEQAAAALAQQGEEGSKGLDELRHGPSGGGGRDGQMQAAAEEIEEGEEHELDRREKDAVLPCAAEGRLAGFVLAGCGMDVHGKSLSGLTNRCNAG